MMICQWCRWLFLIGCLIASTRIREASSFAPPLSTSRTRRIHPPLYVFVPENINSESKSTNSSSNRRSKDDAEAQRFFRGAPSTPGFKPGQFEKLTRWAISTSSNRPVVAEYDPDGLWLWTRWDGTIRQMTFQNVIGSLLWALIVDLYAYYHYTVYLIATAAVNGGDVSSLISNLAWTSFEIPHSKDPIIDTLGAINGLWEYQLSLTIFTLSFFVNHAYTQWRMTYFATRAIQGRINGLCMLVSAGAKRSAAYGDVDGTTGYARSSSDGATTTEGDAHFNNNGDGTTATTTTTPTTTTKKRDARTLVEDIARYLRMSHTFFWASTPTHSDGFGDTCVTEGGIIGDDDLLARNFDASQFGPMLLSDEGLDMLVDYEQLTQREKEALIATGLPPSQYSYVMLEWAGIRCIDGMDKGELRGTQAMEDNILRLLNELRAEYFNIGDYNAGRMPMAYVQVMEVFVDTLTILAPLALYTKMGTFNIISSGLLTLFFKGLLELSKSFLDPFGREGYRAHNIRVDVLVSELNFGASSRWIDAGDALPSEILISDDDAAAFDQVVGSTTAPPVVNGQSTNPPDANVEQNYETLGKMTTKTETTMTADEQRVNGDDMKEAPIMGPRFRRGDVSDVE
eukprot:scaffold5194_cov144-Skeletonema_menzelii.AAC.3